MKKYISIFIMAILATACEKPIFDEETATKSGHEQNANVTKLDHNQAMVTDSFKKVQLTVTCETHNEEHIQRIVTALEKAGFEINRVY